MKKVIITRDNYEEVMFDLIEDTYPKDIRNNILDQIHADTFLNFEWTQWSKALYSESVEMYKTNEAEFIEGLTKEEEKKKGFLFYFVPFAVAASILLLVGLYIGFYSETPAEMGIVNTIKNNQLNTITPEKVNKDSLQNTFPIAKKTTVAPVDITDPIHVIKTSPVPFEQKKDTTLFVEEKKTPIDNIPAPMDTIRTMIAAAKKQSRYRVTIVENQAAEDNKQDFKFIEKRYTMADVLNRKDGISLSKFLQSTDTRLVTDKNTNRVTIEYKAADNSVLVLVLSN